MHKEKFQISRFAEFLSFFLCSLFRYTTFRFVFSLTLAGVKCRVKRLPVLYYSADYISISFGNIELIRITKKIQCLLSRSAASQTTVQVIFYFLLDHWAHPGYFENRILLKQALGGVCSLANYSDAYEETQSNQVSDFCDFVCSLFPKAFLFYFYCIWRDLIKPILRFSIFCVFFVCKGNCRILSYFPAWLLGYLQLV